MKKVKIAGPSSYWLRPSFMTIPYCPGCQEPVAASAILEVLEEIGSIGDAIAVPGVGCNSPLGTLMGIDFIMSAHGRPPDVATAIKRILKYPLVFTIQGDGDCISIGAGSLINAAMRGEKITIIMLNNINYGTTGGQMSPTTLLDQRTSTSPTGRDPQNYGYPVHVPELLGNFKGVAYTARGAFNNPANFQRTKRFLKKAFEAQKKNIGLSFVEIIVSCPPNWHMSPVDSLKFIEEKVIPEFPIGEFKKYDEGEK